MGLFGKLFRKGVRKRKSVRCSAVITAAGSSSRMGGENKIFSEIGGIPVIAHTLMAFENCDLIDEIIVTSRSEDIAEIANICSEYDITKAKKIIIGGDTRAGSVYNGVMETSPGAYLIAVHDGARPLVTDDIITKAVLKASVTNAAAPAVPVKDTVKSVVDGKIIGTPDRSTLYAFQTPQVFSGDILKGALQNALEKRLPITDDCMAVEALGIPIYVTEGSYENIKITTPSDLDIAEMILERREDENR